MKKKLTRDNNNKILAGICGGIANYFNIDPTIVRIGWILFCALGGSGIIAYLLCLLIIPKSY
ncbi:MAG: PspC domain-containing protein [Bacilli bacterium]